MTAPMRIRATESGGVTTARVLMTHVMETGMRRGSDGNVAPAHYISNVEATLKGRSVLSCKFSGAVSQNPLLTFRFSGAAKGDRLTIKWVDNRGETRTDEATIA